MSKLLYYAGWSIHPNHGRLVALTATIIYTLDTDLRPCGALLYAILEVDVMVAVPRTVVETVRNFRRILLYCPIHVGLEDIRSLLSVFLHPYGIEHFLGIQRLTIDADIKEVKFCKPARVLTRNLPSAVYHFSTWAEAGGVITPKSANSMVRSVIF